MFVQYGNHVHADNEVALVITKRAVHSPQGQLTGIQEVWNLQGRLQAGSVAGVTTAIQELEAAYAKDNQNITLFVSAGVESAHKIVNADTNSGTLVTTRPSFPTGRNAEYTTFRNYTIVVEALLPSGANDLVSFSESLNIRGTGGPTFGWLLPINGPPIQQQFTQRSLVTLTQRGEAVQMGQYPIPQAPLVPEFEHAERRNIDFQLPADASQRFRTTWSYVMELPFDPGRKPGPSRI